MPKEIKLPLPKTPETMPGEKLIRKVLSRVGEGIDKFPLTTVYNKIRDSVPSLAEQKINTPLGSVKLPPVDLPEMKKPYVDDRRWEALKAASAQDFASLVALVPLVGDIASDFIEDTYGAKIQETLTPKELEWFRKYDKQSPVTTIAMLRTMVKIRE